MKPGARRSTTASPWRAGAGGSTAGTGNYFPLYDREVARIIHQVRPDLLHVHNRPLLALSLARRFGGEIPVILHMHNLYESLGKRERPRPGSPIPVAGFAACSNFVLERERSRLGLGAGLLSGDL